MREGAHLLAAAGEQLQQQCDHGISFSDVYMFLVPLQGEQETPPGRRTASLSTALALHRGGESVPDL